jgi:hypothetical protein
VPRLYNEEQLQLRESLETSVREVRGWGEIAASCEIVSSQYGREHGSCGTYSDEAVIRRQPGKIQQTEK